MTARAKTWPTQLVTMTAANATRLPEFRVQSHNAVDREQQIARHRGKRAGSAGTPDRGGHYLSWIVAKQMTSCTTAAGFKAVANQAAAN